MDRSPRTPECPEPSLPEETEEQDGWEDGSETDSEVQSDEARIPLAPAPGPPAEASESDAEPESGEFHIPDHAEIQDMETAKKDIVGYTVKSLTWWQRIVRFIKRIFGFGRRRRRKRRRPFF